MSLFSNGKRHPYDYAGMASDTFVYMDILAGKMPDVSNPLAADSFYRVHNGAGKEPFLSKPEPQGFWAQSGPVTPSAPQPAYARKADIVSAPQEYVFKPVASREERERTRAWLRNYYATAQMRPLPPPPPSRTRVLAEKVLSAFKRAAIVAGSKVVEKLNARSTPAPAHQQKASPVPMYLPPSSRGNSPRHT